jgi:hypothetical protein
MFDVIFMIIMQCKSVLANFQDCFHLRSGHFWNCMDNKLDCLKENLYLLSFKGIHLYSI